jgi:glycosyltransferase involved in cell wall biosynthesis
MSASTAPFFSVIIPTRNRTGMFREALESVLAQKFCDKEVIVVNDGSTEPSLAQYKSLEQAYPAVNFHYLTHRPNGHGQSYSMNYGADQATGEYLCFLDDDDYWTDPDYLTQVHANVVAAGDTVDLHLSNQKAYFSDGQRNSENVWIEDLIPVVRRQSADASGAYTVDAALLLSSQGFAHLNCSVYRRALYLEMGGMDEGIRYECDRDVYLRGVDAAGCILFYPEYMSFHRIPDAAKKDNMSTLISVFQKKLFQLQVYDKGIALSDKPEMVDYCKRGKAYELRHIARAADDLGRSGTALYYAREALGARISLKWLAYTLSLTVRSWFDRDTKQAPKP